MTELQTDMLALHVGVPALMAFGYLIGSGRLTEYGLRRRVGQSLGFFAYLAFWMAVTQGLILLLRQAFPS